MNDKKLVELDQHIKDKIIEILTGQWLTRPEIFEKLPRLTKIEDVRLINNFIESQINEGIISKKIIGHRLSFGIFKKEDLEPDINNRSENEIKLKSKALLKNWSDTGLRVKVGKTIYIDPDSKKKVKPSTIPTFKNRKRLTGPEMRELITESRKSGIIEEMFP